MKRCEFCRNRMSDSVRYCNVCGAEAPKVYTFGTKVAAFGKGVLYVSFFFLIQLLVTAVYGLVIQIASYSVSPNGYSEEQLTKAMAEHSSDSALVAYGIFLVIILVFFALRRKNFFERTALDASPGIAVLGVGIVGVCLNYVTVLVVSLLPVPESIIEQHEQVYSSMGQGNFVLEIIAVVIGAPILEEIVFRGLCFGTMRKTMSFLPAMLISAAIFGAVHGTVMAFFYASALGALMAYLYEISDSLWVPILLHVGYNGGSYLVERTPDGSVLYYALILFGASVITVCLCAVCMRYYAKKNYTMTDDEPLAQVD